MSDLIRSDLSEFIFWHYKHFLNINDLAWWSLFFAIVFVINFIAGVRNIQDHLAPLAGYIEKYAGCFFISSAYQDVAMTITSSKQVSNVLDISVYAFSSQEYVRTRVAQRSFCTVSV